MVVMQQMMRPQSKINERSDATPVPSGSKGGDRLSRTMMEGKPEEMKVKKSSMFSNQGI